MHDFLFFSRTTTGRSRAQKRTKILLEKGEKYCPDFDVLAVFFSCQYLPKLHPFPARPFVPAPPCLEGATGGLLRGNLRGNADGSEVARGNRCTVHRATGLPRIDATGIQKKTDFQNIHVFVRILMFFVLFEDPAPRPRK